MAQTRTLRFGEKTYHVVKLYSSGLGAQYTLTAKDGASGSTQTLFLSSETVRGNAERTALMDACDRAFDDRWTLDKRL